MKAAIKRKLAAIEAATAPRQVMRVFFRREGVIRAGMSENTPIISRDEFDAIVNDPGFDVMLINIINNTLCKS